MKKALFALMVIAFAVFSCSNNDDVSADTIEPTVPLSLSTYLADFAASEEYSILLCAHRANTYAGITAGIPENSIKAIEKCIEIGVDMIEFDVRPTKDGELVLMHDATIDRTTTGSGAVSVLTYDELKDLKLLDDDGNITDESIPTLAEALSTCKGRVFINLDIANKDVSAATVIALVQEWGVMDEVMFYTSTDKTYASLLKSKDGEAIIHPMVASSSDITTFMGEPYEAIIMQLSSSNATGTTLASEIGSLGGLSFSNITGTNDGMLLTGSATGIVNMINKKVRIIQTDYYELADEYLISKNMRP